MKKKYDVKTDALYIDLKSGKVYQSIKVKPNILVDINKKGEVLGIEILDASITAPKKIRKAAKRKK